jgi:chromosome segregation ATPase
MIFALGFLVAGLAALSFAPAFWRRANRLTRRHLEMRIPLSIKEILAERDQLRAEFAVERCRLDQHADQLTQRHAAVLVQSGRQTTQISGLRSELLSQAGSQREVEEALAQSTTQLTSAEAELGALHKALYDAEGLLERKREEFLDYVRLQESAKSLAEIRFGALAASDARVASLELRVGGISRHLLAAEQKLTEKEVNERNLAGIIESVRRDLMVAETKNARLQERFDSETRNVAQLRDALAALEQQHESALDRLKTSMLKVNTHEAALEDARRREKDILTQRDLVAERAREAERAHSDKYVHLQSQHAAVQGALDVVRRHCEELENAPGNRRPSLASERQQSGDAASASEIALLRESISEIGAALVRLTRSGDGPSIRAALKKDANETLAASHEPAAQ